MTWVMLGYGSSAPPTRMVGSSCAHSGTGQHSADPQRHEVEAVVQVAAYRAGVACGLQVTESVRSALGVKRGSGAYKQLLKQPHIAARSNNLKREQYAYALAAAK